MSINRAFLISGILSLALIGSPTAVGAKAGGLDPTFGKAGKVTTNIAVVGQPFPAIMDGALDSKGNIVVVASNGAGNPAAIARFLPDGALDPFFGTAGVTFTPFSLSGELSQNFGTVAIAIQPNDEIIVGASTTNSAAAAEFALARFTTRGTLDTSFGSGGEVTTSFAGLNAVLLAIILQPNRDIVASGQSSTTSTPSSGGAVLARYTSAGELDHAFGNGGFVSLPGATPVSALALLSSGDILFSSTSVGLLVNANGTVPEAVSQIDGIANVGVMSFQSDGKLVSAAQQETQRDGETNGVLVTRTLPNGLADSTFAAPLFYFNSGTTFREFNQSNPLAVTITPGAQIVVGGSSATSQTQPVFGLARLNANGALDKTFGSAGVLTTPIGQDDGVEKILVQKDSKIVAIGFSGTTLALARYLAQ
ncbi:MAG: hypothetical protein JOZ48_08855 [Acidobacteriaceae bacterium]|nr:hypothetical protein [Acidobacteriaceae bacterium]